MLLLLSFHRRSLVNALVNGICTWWLRTYCFCREVRRCRQQGRRCGQRSNRTLYTNQIRGSGRYGALLTAASNDDYCWRHVVGCVEIKQMYGRRKRRLCVKGGGMRVSLWGCLWSTSVVAALKAEARQYFGRRNRPWVLA